MATELVKVCDFCATEDDTRTPDAETVAITVGGVPYEVEACEQHRKPIDELGAWLAEHARKVTVPEKGAAISLPYVCEVCGRAFNRPNGLTVHRVRTHPAPSESEPVEAAPEPSEPSPSPKPQPVRVLADGRVECPVCGNSFKNRPSLAVHLHGRHGTTLGAVEGNPRNPRK